MSDVIIKPEADRVYGYQFDFKGKKYAFHQWTSDSDSYQILVTEIVQSDGVWVRGKIVAGELSNHIITNNRGGARANLEVLIAELNEYLSAQLTEDEMADAGFPENGTLVEQYNWLLSYGVELVDEEVITK